MNMAEEEKKLEKNKRAWIKILESAIAVMLMIGFFSILTTRHVSLSDLSDEVYMLKRAVLKEASQNDLVRQAVLTNDANTVYDFIRRRLSPSLKFAVRICNPDEKCEIPIAKNMQSEGININSYYPADLTEPKSDIYSDDYLISSSLKGIVSKIIKLFVWFEKDIILDDLNIDKQICGDGEYDNEPTHEECETKENLDKIFFDISGNILSLAPTCQSSPYNAVLGKIACSGTCTIDSSNCEKCDAGQIVFAEDPGESKGKIKFTATGISGTYYIETYTPNKELIGSEVQNYVDVKITTINLLWPSESGSLISIRYNNGCQDYYVVLSPSEELKDKKK